ncbi:hypothetical protein A3F27_03440 [Candidatus Kaiserbacteria bacterium RIFCSPHIGHO2_12_FULL_53_13]|uniref:Uncharacterized protein n=1 Tax=Candidatus Kaiserbacteria bacterium RIFCSPHIGHO2_12_FULL_53_13 TaxID=1798502 RepID=A0A1F6E603_9BACT|nr:MAG: hypothetical protein A3F27_03440 [Candidatus Kaiserbacteria bacterium RIFCSPHIGHO2_12_FULL_53_13]OGG74391.1 MAG: hypothetical protein A3A37_00285 [Candidatus Kaiserbacteria bacterium RIFCSPLOWO2_01_FULL_52_36]
MGNEHANRSGCVLLWRDMMRSEAGFSPIVVSAAVSVAALLVVFGWQSTRTLQAGNAGVRAVNAYLSGEERPLFLQEQSGSTSTPAGSANATSPDPNDFSNVGNEALGQLVGTYVALKKSGGYTAEQGESVANDVASAMQVRVSYVPYKEGDIKTDADTSYKRLLAYRSDLREALRPLLQNTESELDIFARYIDTHDKHNLTVLGEVAQRYKEAADNAARMIVPEDASVYHVGIENALLQFAITLEALVKNADDPMATLALLRSYGNAERDVFMSFDALASYQKRKIP